MARKQGDSTETAQGIIELIGGDKGLSRLRAARVEALPDGLIFNVMADNMTTEGIVVIRKVGEVYRLYWMQLGKWVEARGLDGLQAGDVRPQLWKLIGKHEPAF